MSESWEYQVSGNTPHKQTSFASAIDLHIHIYKKLLNRNQKWIKKPYLYCDLNAGVGVDPEGRDGSPVIFLKTAAKHGLDYKAIFYEYDDNNAQRLHDHCVSLGFDRFTVIRGDNIRLLSDIGESNNAQYGVIYSDVSNAPSVPLDLLKRANSNFKRIDVMINLAFASYKRTVNLPSYTPLYKALPQIKKYWKVRTPIDRFQWSILLGLNWWDYPDQESAGFYDFHSDIGRKYWNAITRTKNDPFNNSQLPLWGDN